MELEITYAPMYSNDTRANVLSPLDASLEIEDISLGILAGTRSGVGGGIREAIAGRVALREKPESNVGPSWWLLIHVKRIGTLRSM